MMDRVRRTRSAPPPLPPLRVRRVRPSPVAPNRRVRTRSAPTPPRTEDRPYFVIDWSRPLTWKLQIYMVTSYLYYVLDKSIIHDEEFDRLCKELADGWDTFTHEHKKYTGRADMVAGTGYANKYPNIVMGAAWSILKYYKEI